MSLSLPADFGYVLAIGAGLYVLQQWVLTGAVVLPARRRSGIKAPTLYPTDAQARELKLTPEQLNEYMNAQRAHQNQVEFSSAFLPLYYAIGLVQPRKTAVAGASILFFRTIGSLAYGGLLPISRRWGGLYHLGEAYLVYLAFRVSVDMIR